MEGETVDKVRMSQDSGMSSVGSLSPADEIGPSKPMDDVQQPQVVSDNQESLIDFSTQAPITNNGILKLADSSDGEKSSNSNSNEDIVLTRNASQASDTDSMVSSSSKTDIDSCSVAELPPVCEEAKMNELLPGDETSTQLETEDKITSSESTDELNEKTQVEMPNFMIFYLGSLELDRRHTPPMLPWVMAEVRRQHEITPIKLVIQSEFLHAMKVDDEEKLIFEHRLHGLTRFARSQQENTIFAYSTRSAADAPFTCHVFQAQETCQVPKLFQAIRQATKNIMRKEHFGNEGKSVDECNELVKMGHEFFEALFVGRVQVNHKKASPSFIDDLVDRFKSETIQVRRRHPSGSSIQSLPSSLDSGSVENDLDRTSSNSGDLSNSEASSAENLHVRFDEGTLVQRLDKAEENIPKVKIRHASASSASQSASQDKPRTRHSSGTDKPARDGENLARDALAGGQAEVGKIMLFKIGGEEVCLISLDHKTVILDRNFKDISFCAQGVRHTDHFGFICRNHQNNTFVCYLFKCASDSVVDEVMRGLQQAFNAAYQKSAKNHHVVCEECPMHQLHKLCQEMEGLTAEQMDDMLGKRVERLSEKDREDVRARIKSEAPMSIEDSNEVTMKALRILCEARQLDHKHISDNNRHPKKGEFCLVDPAQLGKVPSGVPTQSQTTSKLDRVRRSLTSSFEFLKDTSTSNTPDISPCPSPIKKEFGEKHAFKRREDFAQRPRSHTVDSGYDHKLSRKISAPQRTSVGEYFNYSPRPSPNKHNSSRAGGGDYSPASSPRRPAHQDETPPRRRMGSWRQAIFISVVTPVGKSRRRSSVNHDDSHVTNHDYPRSPLTSAPPPPASSLTKDELRALWRKAILETLLLIRMEKENKHLQARQDEMETKRIKLNYEEITPCLIKVTKVWEDMIKTPNRPSVKIAAQDLCEAVKAGVPRSRRGDIWQVLVEQHSLSNSALHHVQTQHDAAYHDLLRQLTTHQHAILIDLGRTFPAHPYFSTQLGAGQLALFNLLKSYSLLDAEVGYCQGLSFVAGVLLMHMQEEQAFHALKYIMFNMGLRAQYRPDMTALQIQLYQLSRLLHDHYKDLYDHFEMHEINPTLYAAPWFLTLFASQFPLGFVARVFDLLLLQGVEVIFKVAITLLGYHKELIMQCDSFESVVEFLKTTLPAMGVIQMERVFNQVFVMDISQKLKAYEVEYHVLQEEMLNSPRGSETDTILRLEATNASIRQYNGELIEQLNAANSTQRSLESTIQTLCNNENKLKSHIQTLELERAALLNTVQKLKELIPAEAMSRGESIDIPRVTPATTHVGSPLHTNARAATRERKKPANLNLQSRESSPKRQHVKH